MRLGGKTLARYIRLVGATAKWQAEPSDYMSHLLAHHPAILTGWHGQFLLHPLLYARGITNKIIPEEVLQEVPVRAMVARHHSADFIAATMEEFGVAVIRGGGAGHRKKDVGGASALKQAVSALKKNSSVFLTADVPPGPPRRCGTGIIALARLSGRPIMPIAVVTRRFLSLDTWSRFTLNLPFSPLAICVGDPIFVPEDVDEDQIPYWRNRLDTALEELHRRAYALVGGDAEETLPYCRRQTPVPPGKPLAAYRAVTTLAKPLAGTLLSYRVRKGKEIPARLGERYGKASQPRPEGPVVWFHAASVGETNAVLPLIAALKRARPDVVPLLTTMTTTSARLAEQRLPMGAIHQFVPLDSTTYVRRFLAHWRPAMALFVESEIWPNLILETTRRGIPLMLLNARLSKKTYRMWRRRRGLSLPLFSAFDIIFAQDEGLARRYERLGGRHIIVTGNLKIDAPPPPVPTEKLRPLKSAFADRPLFLAASTHPGEDDIILAAHKQLRHQVPSLLTVLLPRHPHRGKDIAHMAEQAGLPTCLRSERGLPDSRCQVYVADTIGEIGLFYSLADLSFIGGSLVPHGGQNPVEAIKLGASVLAGPHHFNFLSLYRALFYAGGARQVLSAEDMAESVAALLHDPEARRRMQDQARKVVAELSGALERTLAEILPRLPPPEWDRKTDEPLRHVS